MKKHSLTLAFAIITVSLFYILVFPFAAAYHARAAIRMCATSVVPTLFTFMVLTRMLSHLCSMQTFGGKITLFLSRLLNVPACLIPLCIMGLICGAPSGAFGICRMYDEGYCTKDEAERAVILTSNCSAAFILGFISALLGSKTAGLYIFLSNLLSTLTVYFIFFREGERKTGAVFKKASAKTGFCQILTESISSSVTAVVTLCGYVVLFYTLTQIICERLSPFLSSVGFAEKHISFITAVTSSLFEVTSGILHSAKAGGNLSAVLCSGAAAFTGLSIILQITGIMSKSKLSSKKLILSKCLCAFLCPVFVVVILLVSPMAVYVSTAQSVRSGVTVSDIVVLAFVTVLAFAGAYVLTLLDKKHKK